MSEVDDRYDDSDRESILMHAQKLLGRSLAELYGRDIVPLEEAEGGRRRGKFGQLVEKVHFGIKNNSAPLPDFPKVGVELKTSPLKMIRRGSVPNERIVLN